MGKVRARIPTTALMAQKLPAVGEAERAVRRLTADGGPEDRRAFVRFMQACPHFRSPLPLPDADICPAAGLGV